MTQAAAALRARIAAEGPLRLDHWMAACNAAYYDGGSAARDPFGAGGDFVTAPEISQMFGELVGGWIADLWLRAGSPAMRLVELGPGRGTLMADALRVAMRLPAFAEKVQVAFVETSAGLRAAQASRVTGARWFDCLGQVPDDLPIVVIANEFFDALPIRQFLGGMERAVAVEAGVFTPVAIAAEDLGDFALAGEVCEPGRAIAAQLAAHFSRKGGAALIIDYGYDGVRGSDSLQALHRHKIADPFANPGGHDLTAHVDFTALAAAAVGAAAGIRVSGPLPQGVWLARLGIEARATALKARATAVQAAGIEAALVRLTAPAAMGALFKVMVLSAPSWPVPAGFTA